jgi:SagB-type dehydrogenase family enzyme
MSRRFKHDLRYALSALLLVATVAATLTGLLADVWDLNDFVAHTYTGYGMAALALAHTALEWPRLWAYIRARWRDTRARRRRDDASPTTSAPASSDASTAGPLLRRRDLVSLLIGGVGGFVLGRTGAGRAPRPEDADPGMRYHDRSKVGVPNPLVVLRDWGQRPPQYKAYPDAPHISLPAPGAEEGLLLEGAIRQRRSIRGYAAPALSLAALSRLLYHADGINAQRGSTRLRAAPSAGALYPIEMYVVAHRVAGLEPGLYHYAVREHALARLRTEDLSGEVVRAGIMQQFLGEANLVLILTAIFQRLRWKYQARTYRYALLEAGHIGQNIYLAATAMGMGACAVGAFNDGAVNALVGVDGVDEAALYLLSVGEPR